MGSLERSSYWYLITIDDDPNFLPGKSVFDLIQLFLKQIPFKYVILNDIVGAAEQAEYLREKEGEVLEIKELLENICEVIQFEWGDFFLFKESPDDWTDENMFYPNLIKQTDTTIRTVDGEYLYIYTPYEEILKIIKENYTIESVKQGPLETLDYPY